MGVPILGHRVITTSARDGRDGRDDWDDGLVLLGTDEQQNQQREGFIFCSLVETDCYAQSCRERFALIHLLGKNSTIAITCLELMRYGKGERTDRGKPFSLTVTQE